MILREFRLTVLVPSSLLFSKGLLRRGSARDKLDGDHKRPRSVSRDRAGNKTAALPTIH